MSNLIFSIGIEKQLVRTRFDSYYELFGIQDLPS
jgi:hypothetical protein